MLPALVALAGGLLAATAGDDGDLRVHFALHARATDRENIPAQDVLFDPVTRAFLVAGYLRPSEHDAYPSTLVAAGVEGRTGGGRLTYALTLDTGEVRSQSFPETVVTCVSDRSPTGLDLLGSGRCALPRRVAPVPSTVIAPAEITMNGRPAGDEVSSTLLVREAYAALAFGRAQFGSLRVGRKRFTFADGFVYDDYGLGAETDLDLGALGPQWDVALSAIYPTRDIPTAAALRSPMLAIRADHLPSLFEHVGLFALLAHDETGSVADLFRSSAIESSVLRLQGTAPGTAVYIEESRRLAATLARRLDGTATLAWVGTSGDLALRGRQRLGFTGSLAFGRLTLLVPGPLGELASETAVPVLGKLVSLRHRWQALDDLSIGAFFLWLSGDIPPTEKSRLGVARGYGGFLGVAPYVTTTNIFFNGGVSESFAARQVTAPGVNGRGAIAPGLTATWTPLGPLGFTAKEAYLVADALGPYGGRVYGPEVDLDVTWEAADWLLFAAEADVLWPGDFFGGGSPITKVVFGVDLVRL